jgi:pimeloyl-ACP methyl ester carboxylesterase
MIPAAFGMRKRLGALRMPVVVVAGALDRLIDTHEQSARLHADVEGSSFHLVSGAGHMVHQTAPEAVMAAIDEAAEADARPAPRAVCKLRS